jgi:Lysylphosphatidylglycerol synthase TM region
MSEPSVPKPASLEDVSWRRTAWARGVPVALTVVIFLLIFWRIPFGSFWNAIVGARMLPFLALIGWFSLCFFLVDTFVLSRLIRWFHGPLPYRDLLPVRAVTYLVSILNTQLAQAALALYIHRRFHTPLAQITSTVALMILLETTNLILFSTVGAIAFPGGAPMLLLALPLVLGMVWMLLISLARGKLGVLSRRLGDSVLLSTFRRVRWRHCAIILGLKGSVFCLALLVHSQALLFFGIEIPLVRLVTFLPVVFLVGALPITVAHLGTSQAAWIFFFSNYASEADLLAYSLVSHLTFMLANGTFGVFFLPKAYSDLFLKERMG